MNWFKKSNIKLKIILGFCLAFLSFLVVQYFSNKSIENLKSSEQGMLISTERTREIETVQSSIEAYNDKINLFLLTRNTGFLQGNEDNVNEATDNLHAILERSSGMKADQVSVIRRLDSLVRADLEFNQNVLIEFNNKDSRNAIELVNAGRGKSILNEIAGLCNQAQEIEQQNLATIVANNELFSRKVVYMDYAASVFAILVILFSIVILFRDINSRIRIEKELRIAQAKAEQSALMKEQFMANMSHEIRTPMNAILGFTNLLAASKLDEKQSRYTRAIQSSGENLLNIINDILDFSKIEAGMLRIEKIPFHLPALLHSLNVLFMTKVGGKSVKLDFYTPGGLPEIVAGDPTRLTQILVNLIGNAIKFTSEGSISVYAEVLKSEGNTVTIQFTVRDTGIGIPKEKMEEIFDRFTQAEADTSRKYGGSGLGLSIAKRLVELQGGSIRVESAEGVGSSFSFVIPYEVSDVKKITASGSQVMPPDDWQSFRKILVAEDNLMNRQLIESLLDRWGYEFVLVENGRQVVERLQSEYFDLLLLDIQMPVMNGYETAKYIRQHLHSEIPVIAMTAHVLPGEKEKCLSYGMTDYISKPLREPELFNLIQMYTQQQQYSEATKKSDNLGNALSPTAKVTNLEYLETLANGKSAFVEEMKELFLSENPQEIRQLENAIQKRDYEVVGHVAHKIKSTIPFVGLDLLIGKNLTEMEQLAESHTDWDAIINHFGQVQSVCLKAIEELKTTDTNHV